MERATRLVVVYGVIVNDSRKMLVVQRAEHDTHPLMWEFPGGLVEENEDPISATKREVFEETGVRVDPLYPISVASDVSSSKNQLVVRIAFLCKYTGGEIILSNEHNTYQWISEDDALKLKHSDLLAKTIEVLKINPYLIKI
ncbi:MAG: NUDIX hydrolase [Candidatus Levybacteria bacterium]|nr:NUDIX hydrolase [Candidatus Levybacteria bacterium]